ncbi:MFS transporter [Actinosynnema mirum]|uniref:Major facilitator superfamily MFS_1 n=1 Tax=Actinosynnema mirum (strain ATCC 29888 / DSM 43827 / JCM 3225 / NBRC 14064 / NCIMB 13271 / NRRL B-12336 / IMRU 3971 / 101) TaxID=446462 RepID=C6WFN9_ACTMD|nr:MFS transporter [Actinosynnema mirum]ACU35974.1 major facilitator superfamily MFS_1 [Actinosynnema mirum DSM 43827]
MNSTAQQRLAARTTGMFRALRVRNYQVFTFGRLISGTGVWIQRIAQDWLVISLTGSAAALGVTTALQFLPILLFGLWGGLLSDRFSRRLLLVISQTAMGVIALGLALLTCADQVEIWHVYVAAFLLGVASAVETPARQSFLSEMVGKDLLHNAVSLDSACFQVASLAGPAISGVLINLGGTSIAFALSAASCVVVIASLWLLRPAELHPHVPEPRAPGQVREGLRHVYGHPSLLWPIVLMAFLGTFAFNFALVLPVYTADIFHSGAETFGWLTTYLAVGSVAGALGAAWMRRAGLPLVLATALGFCVVQLLAAASPSVWLFGALMVPTGALGVVVHASATSVVQSTCAPSMRGRVMGVYNLAYMGGIPISGPLVGWVMERFGARPGYAISTAVALVGALVAAAAVARIHHRTHRTHRGPGAADYPSSSSESKPSSS